MKIVLSVLCSFATLLTFGSAQYYGSHGFYGRDAPYGRDILIRQQRPIYQPNIFQSQVAPSLQTRFDADMSQDIRLAAAQISRGSEMFSFDMYRVSFTVNAYIFNLV